LVGLFSNARSSYGGFQGAVAEVKKVGLPPRQMTALDRPWTDRWGVRGGCGRQLL